METNQIEDQWHASNEKRVSPIVETMKAAMDWIRTAADVIDDSGVDEDGESDDAREFAVELEGVAGGLLAEFDAACAEAVAKERAKTWTVITDAPETWPPLGKSVILQVVIDEAHYLMTTRLGAMRRGPEKHWVAWQAMPDLLDVVATRKDRSA